ncbi:efflux RND transporter periplasmic adaptor subunit [Leptobacterium flavescens]|uniref:Efflux RND transporter periplasmic adaptor subunit n=1 Tax=Leptobacterium flavescens TaxID=472055 RepID=A0A6P0USL1_9FLAO|nr:efflux RND transporter periplasmic adaptor subunit [Leptobacterium flavescens]NER14809.1 efflux RND transporter periplasmic adaptor subunit [Leptobacterium flavescens]
MKTYIKYSGILIAGLLLGWLLFGRGGSSEVASNASHEHTEDENGMWTCSMHPQIQQPEPGQCPICAMDLVPVSAEDSGSLEEAQFKLSERAVALANIQTTMVGDVQSTEGGITLSGKIMENEEGMVMQASHFGGRVEKLYINSTGEKIYPGKLLAEIYSPKLVTAQEELLTALEIRSEQPELYKAVRSKLKLWKLSEAQIHEIQNSGKVKYNIPVYADVSGIVTEKMIEEGEHVSEGGALYKVTNLNTVWAVFDAYESQIKMLRKGQKVKVKVNAFPDEEIDAVIDFVDPVLNTTTRTVPVRVVLRNSNDKLKPGMFVSGRIVVNLQEGSSQISIPKSAVLWTGKRSVVYVKSPAEGSVFEMREVELGNAMNDSYMVISGLENGEEVVTNGAFTVDAAAQLQGKKSMMNKDGGRTSTGHEHHQMNMEGEQMNMEGEPMKMEVETAFQDQLRDVFLNYEKLKDHLVADKAEDAGKSAKAVLTSLEKVDMKLLKDQKMHQQWMAIEKEIRKTSTSIGNSKDIAEQRKAFKPLSEHMIYGVELFGINQKVYKQFCPMYDNNAGANWLSLEKEIRNPYFGDAMLTCGEVKKTIE